MATLSSFPQEPNPFTVQWVIAIYQEFCRTEQHFRAVVEMRSRDISHLKEGLLSIEHQLEDKAAQVEMQQQMLSVQSQLISSLRSELTSHHE